MILFVNYLRALVQIKTIDGHDAYVYYSKVLSVTTKQIEGTINQNLKCSPFEIDIDVTPKRVFVNFTLDNRYDGHVHVENDIKIHSVSLKGGFNPEYMTEDFNVDESFV